nr:class I SAM-dependent methyltransferase [Brucepastera parasyntrophica]
MEPNNVILDIGFGNGYLLKKLYKLNIPIKMYGIEVSKDMFDRVFLKNEQLIRNRDLRISLESIQETEFESNTFDRIYTINTIYFWNELGKSFSEIKRILKPDGIFLNIIYTKEFLDKIIYTKYGFQKYTIEEIGKITEENGMRILDIVEITKKKSYCIIAGNKK